MIKNYGYIAPKIEPEHYVFGGLSPLSRTVLQSDGQWDSYLPIYKPQFGGDWDTDGCTVWGTQNALEILSKRVLGADANFSERFTYDMVPVRPPGGDPHAVAECIRADGLVQYDSLPMTETFADFCTPTPMTSGYLAEGQQWLNKTEFGHEWVFTKGSKEAKTELMKNALTYSPLGVAVTAWIEGADGIYIDEGQPNCHWCACYGWDDAKRAWKIFDSYDQSEKLYSFDAEISVCKRYTLAPKTLKKNWLQQLFCKKS